MCEKNVCKYIYKCSDTHLEVLFGERGGGIFQPPIYDWLSWSQLGCQYRWPLVLVNGDIWRGKWFPITSLTTTSTNPNALLFLSLHSSHISQTTGSLSLPFLSLCLLSPSRVRVNETLKVTTTVGVCVCYWWPWICTGGHTTTKLGHVVTRKNKIKDHHHPSYIIIKQHPSSL